MFPTLWVETATQAYMNRFKEIALGLEDEFGSYTPEVRLTRAMEEINKSAVPTLFQHKPFDSIVQARIDENNKLRQARPWTYDHILGGTEGCHMEEPKMQKPFDNDAMCRLFGLASMLSGRQ